MNKKLAWSGATSALFLLFFSSLALAVEPDFRNLVKKVSPSVVHITFERVDKGPSNPRLNPRRMAPSPFMDPFGMFDDFYGVPDNYPRPKVEGAGSGFIISEDGYIVTNNHVIEGADTVKVFLNVNGRSQADESEGIVAKVVGSDPDTDLALLKIEEKNLPFLSFGDSDVLDVGEWVLAIGSPYGLNQSVTAGIVSAKGRKIRVGKYDDFLQTDASINSGNSGGPLVNMKGEVVGINSMIIRPAQGIGFAIPSSMAKRIIEDLRENKKVSRGWFGITLQNIDAATAKALGLPNREGALINNVLPDEPADKAGLKSGDVIVAVDGQAIKDVDQLLLRVAMLSPGKSATVTIWRDGKKIEKSILVSERGNYASGKDASKTVLGLRIRSLTLEEREQMKVRNGILIVDIDRKGLGSELGLQTQDIILSVNMEPVTSVEEFNRLVANAEKNKLPVLLYISRNGQTFYKGYDFSQSR